MHRSILLLLVCGLLLVLLACGSYAGQNGLKDEPDGYVPIPVYEAGPPPVFDATFDARDAAQDHARESSTDAPGEATKEGAADAPTSDSPSDAPTGDAPKESGGG